MAASALGHRHMDRLMDHALEDGVTAEPEVRRSLMEPQTRLCFGAAGTRSDDDSGSFGVAGQVCFPTCLKHTITAAPWAALSCNHEGGAMILCDLCGQSKQCAA